MAFPRGVRYRCAMTFDYDRLYGETADALGLPSPVFVDFFDRLERENARILDVGCGQGRDALFIAGLGHRVVGVDTSPNGIRALNEAAGRQALAVEGSVADITDYVPDGVFDVVLIDRTLHMLAETPRLAVLAGLLDHVADNGWLLIADEPSNIAGLEGVIAAHDGSWTIDYRKRGILFVRREAG